MVTIWFPGTRSSIRNSPRSSLTDLRRTEEPESCVTIFAEGMGAPVASRTVPRRVPRGFLSVERACEQHREPYGEGAPHKFPVVLFDRSELRQSRPLPAENLSRICFRGANKINPTSVAEYGPSGAFSIRRAGRNRVGRRRWQRRYGVHGPGCASQRWWCSPRDATK
jgi:hypothetical protein